MQTSDSNRFWQRFAFLYGPAMYGSRILYQDICHRMRPRLTSAMNVLELACGTGQLSFPLAPRVHSWQASDFSPAMIEQARKKPAPSTLSFSVENATALPYPDHCFDAVVIANALHVMPQPELAMKEIRRVLKPDGLLFAPNFLHPVTRSERLRLRLLMAAGFRPFHLWNEAQYNAFLHTQGFSIVEQCVLGSGLLPLCYAVARPSVPR